MDERIQAICEQVVDSWTSMIGSKPNIQTYLFNTLDEMLPILVRNELAARHPEFIRKLADSAVEAWAANGDIWRAPSPDAKKKLDGVINVLALSKSDVLSAGERKRVLAYRLHCQGVGAKEIGVQLNIGERSARELVRAAKAKVASLKQGLSFYDSSASALPPA